MASNNSQHICSGAWQSSCGWSASLTKSKSAPWLHVASHTQTDPATPPYEPAVVDCPKLAIVGLAKSDNRPRAIKSHRSHPTKFHCRPCHWPSHCQEVRQFGNIPFLTWLKFVHNGGPVPHMSRGRSRGHRWFWERRVAWQRHMHSFRFVSFYITPVSTNPPASAHH